MSRILLAWELGDGLGHVTRILKIAQKLASLGHDCMVVCRDIEGAGQHVQKAGFDVIAAPETKIELSSANNLPPSSAGDILGFIGFTEPNRLGPLVRAWDALVRRLDPDLVILDYAPTARLAIGPSRSVIVIGDGFTTPPAVEGRFPKFRPAPLLVDEAKIMETIHTVQAEYGGWCPGILPELFEGNRTFIITLPELDSFAKTRKQKAVGPLLTLPKPVEDTPTVDYFAYLSATAKGINKTLTALNGSGLKGSIFLRDSSQKGREYLLKRNFTVHEGPQDMAQMAAMSRMVIHHGGVGTCETLLGLGRPQFIFPRHVEQRLNAKILVASGIADSIPSIEDVNLSEAHAKMQKVAHDDALAQRARNIGKGLAARPHASLDTIVANCIELLP